jgi:hypothetical protein
MTRRLFPTIVVCAVALAACGGGGSSRPNAGADPSPIRPGASDPSGATTVDPFASTSRTRTPQGPPIGKIRVANLVTDNGKPGPALDVYDTDEPASTDVALIRNLQFGRVSDYVSPRGWAANDVTSNLYLFPAGSLTKTDRLNGSNIDNSGFQKDDQMTVVLMAPTGGLDGLASEDVAESGSRVNTSVVPEVPAGRGLLIVRDAAQPEGAAEHYLLADGSCPNPVGQSSHIPVGLGSSSFALTPGPHALALTTSPKGKGLTTCVGAKAIGKTSVTIGAGERVEAFVYGDPAAPQLVTAAVG